MMKPTSPKTLLSLPLILGLYAYGQTSAPYLSSLIDVPAITEEYGHLGYDVCDMGCTFVESTGGHTPFPGTKLHRRTRYTCADKRRFLMTAEDNTKHCILLRNPSATVTK